MEKEVFKFIESFKKFRESDNFQLYRNLRKARLILYSLRRNYSTLSKSFNEFHRKEADPEFWSNSSPYLRRNIQKRITTDLLNYLSSASSIVDISRNFSRKELSAEDLTEYKQIVNITFDNDVNFQIIKKLRNYILHYSLIEIGVLSNWDWETGKTRNTFLIPQRLSTWDKWNKEEKRYLQSKGERYVH